MGTEPPFKMLVHSRGPVHVNFFVLILLLMFIGFASTVFYCVVVMKFFTATCLL